MKQRLKKLLAVTVPALVALAIAPGSASAWSFQPFCYSGFELTAASLTTKKADVNGDGLVCVPLKSTGNVKDDSFYLVW